MRRFPIELMIEAGCASWPRLHRCGRGGESNLRQTGQESFAYSGSFDLFRSSCCCERGSREENKQRSRCRRKSISRRSQTLWPEPIARDITFKTLDEIDLLTSRARDAASARVCVCRDSNLILILPRVAEASQDFDGPPDYTKNCRTFDITF
jgi:hypothetical protein